jgi:hypothetical protein
LVEETTMPSDVHGTAGPSSAAKTSITTPSTTDNGHTHPPLRTHARPHNSQWHRAPPSPASTPRSLPHPPPTAPRATHGLDSTLPPVHLRRRTYTSAVSNGGTRAPLHASTASRAPFRASASPPSHSPDISSLSSYSSRTRAGTTMS